MEKTKIFNVIILDKSGSMSSIRQAAIDGVNETISGITISQKEHEDTQQHYILLNAFCSHGIDTIYNNVKIDEAKNMEEVDYRPCCSTPLYDTIGITLSKLEERLEEVEDYMVFVTVITDGYENASVKYSGADIKNLIERLKEKGWSFSYLGSDHDVEKVAGDLSFDRFQSFQHTGEDTKRAFRERNMERWVEARALDEVLLMERSEGKKFSNKERLLHISKKLNEMEGKDTIDRKTPPFNTPSDLLDEKSTEQEKTEEKTAQPSKEKKGIFRRLFSK
ncbi:MAG: hypothetical protein IJ748_01155 [Bacteroidales bacterium]|nr:hypothetical protein [Bacteroidales bacterium]